MTALVERLIPIRWRAAALLPAAALTVHQLRYELAYGGNAGRELAAQGHSSSLRRARTPDRPSCRGCPRLISDPVCSRLAGGRGPRPTARSYLGLWGSISVSLILIYAGQEFCEGMLESGHPAGLAGVLGGGGWLAVPLAVALGGLVALCSGVPV